ncbi:spermatid perinuclear RNA-binding protein-like isoform X3 [Macrobrachium rosenbergii]|uniref:spermatid perinuclear RNA-binding protein-like isoform X3 n=1 Tax=Macrobrachium rosenbergii TaxID=79674 RepID=UPI0034D5BEFD
MEGNGYYPENDQGFGDGWGNNNRRNTSAQGGLYGNEPFMQRGLYDYSTSSYGGDMGGGQRLTGYGGNRMSSSNMYGSEMGSQRMPYGFGDMDMQNPSSQRDMSYGNTGSFSSMDQTGRRTFDDYDGSVGGEWQNKGMKRSDPGFKQGGPYPKKKKNPLQGQKNPVSFLNEIRPDAKFNVSDMEGPSNMPTFRVSLEFDGETYTASAKSKKLAKRFAAEAALRVYLQTPTAIQLGYSESMIEFSDGAEEAVTQGNDVESDKKTNTTATKPSTDEAALGGKNPVMYLNELRKDVAYDLKEETGQAHNKNFIMRVTVSGQEFEGSGQSKKLARAAAALEALKGLGLMNKISPITQDNKGYQMLQKMGWNGTGLGAKEQGITNCIEPVKY